MPRPRPRWHRGLVIYRPNVKKFMIAAQCPGNVSGATDKVRFFSVFLRNCRRYDDCGRHRHRRRFAGTKAVPGGLRYGAGPASASTGIYMSQMTRFRSALGVVLVLCAALAGCNSRTNVSATGSTPNQFTHVFISAGAVWFNTNANASPFGFGLGEISPEDSHHLRPGAAIERYARRDRERPARGPWNLQLHSGPAAHHGPTRRCHVPGKPDGGRGAVSGGGRLRRYGE